jgi:hypothetical protein
MAEVSEQAKMTNLETCRNDVNNRITNKRENISNCNRVRALGVILTLAFCRPGYGTGAGLSLEILAHVSAIPPPEQNLLIRERQPDRPANSKRPRSTST